MDQIEPLDRIALEIGPIHIYWYGVIIAAAALIGFLIALREGRKRGLPQDTYVDLILIAAPIAIICARAYYVVFQWPYYAEHPGEIIAIWRGGIAIYGALIGAVVTAVIFCRVRGLSFWKVADIAAPSLIIGQAIGRWGNFINQEAHGVETTREALENLHLPEFIVNQMLINGTYYVPTFLYESLWNFIGFIILIVLRRVNLQRGELFLSYIIWYAIGRWFIEGMRTDSLMLGDYRVSQLLSIVLLVGCVALILYWRLRPGKRPRYTD